MEGKYSTIFAVFDLLQPKAILPFSRSVKIPWRMSLSLRGASKRSGISKHFGQGRMCPYMLDACSALEAFDDPAPHCDLADNFSHIFLGRHYIHSHYRFEKDRLCLVACVIKPHGRCCLKRKRCGI